MKEDVHPIFTDPSKFYEDVKWFHLDENYVPPDPWKGFMANLLDETVEDIAELAEDIGVLVRVRAKTTDLDTLGKIAKLIDLNQAMIKEYQDELASQKAAYSAYKVD